MKTSLRKPLGSSFLLLVLTASLTVGCRAKTSLPGAGNANPDMGAKGAQLPVQVPKPQPILANPFSVTANAKAAQYDADKAVELQIEVTNTSKADAQLQFASGQKFDFFARLEGSDEVVWSWGMNKRFMQMVSSQMVTPGKSVKFEANWPNAKPGTYSVTGVITANGGLPAPAFTVVVK